MYSIQSNVYFIFCQACTDLGINLQSAGLGSKRVSSVHTCGVKFYGDNNLVTNEYN